MDDGCFTLRSKGLQERTQGGSGRVEICVEAMSPASRAAAEHLRDHFGLPSRLMTRGKRQQQVLQFNTATTTKFQQLIAPYVHPSMDYKLLERFRGQFDVEPEFVEPTMHPVPARVVDVHVKPPTRSMHRFDIEVEGTHNYFADGVMVHNSPGDDDRWQGAEVLRLDPARRPAHRDPQGRHRRGRQPDPGQGRQEQGRAAVQTGRVRHHLWAGHQPRGRPDRRGCRRRLRAQGRRLVHLRGRPARPGQGERSRVPARQPRPRRRDREEDQGEARHRSAGRRAGERRRTGDSDRCEQSDRAEPGRRRADPARQTPGPQPTRSRWPARSCSTSSPGRPAAARSSPGKLAAKQVPEEVGERLLDRFEEVGLVDDEAFARAWVQSRQSARDWPGGP